MRSQHSTNLTSNMLETTTLAETWRNELHDNLNHDFNHDFNHDLNHDRRDDPDDQDELTTDCLLVPHEVRLSTFGERGVYATAPVVAGTPVVVFGGFVIAGSQFRTLPLDRQRHSFQIGEDLFMACGETLNDGDLLNHSCEPNLGFVSEISLVAVRPIEPGDELTFDYATCDSSAYDEFECECGTASCRVKVTGEDWMSPTVQEARAGFFSPYLQRRIDNLGR